MKRMLRSLITLALCAPLLTGCDLFETTNIQDFPDLTVQKLELKDYSQSVALNEKYTFDGKVYATIEDDIVQEVTKYCTFRDVDTSKLGNAELRVDLETKSKIYFTKTNIFVYDPALPEETNELSGIVLKDYSTLVAMNSEYTFDGHVYAVYKDNTEKDVTSYCTFSEINTSSSGSVVLRVDYDFRTATSTGNFSAEAKLTVYDPSLPDEPKTITSIELRDYSSNVALNSSYEFDGHVFAIYDDNTEDEVTSNCRFNTVSTSVLGNTTLQVEYVTRFSTHSATATIFVYDPLLPDEVKPIDKIVLRNYTSKVGINTPYVFDGQVVAIYKDETEEEITGDYSISNVDTSKLGKATLTVEYVTRYNSYSTSANILVYDPDAKSELLSISVSNYTESVEKGAEYTFDGEIYATYEGVEDPMLISSDDCIITSINTDSVGKKSLSISYTDFYNDEDGIERTVTKSVTITIIVYDPNARTELLSISVENYTSEIQKGSTYVFDGEVYATYRYVDEPVLVSNEDCKFSSISTTTTGKKSMTVSFTDVYYDDEYVEHSVTKNKTISIEVYVNPESISSKDLEVGIDRTKQIELTFSPTSTTRKNVTYTSNDTSIATVDNNGVVTGVAVGTTSITVRSTAVSSVSTTVNVTVTEIAKDAWTILMYVCGADLESDSDQGGQATEDLKEIASVNGQPDDVNVVVQAGGAKSWKSTYSSVINKDKTNRFHLKNKTYVKDEQITKANMGLASTLQSFLTWGIETYPAENYGLIFWNHGGAMGGCCYDEFSNDPITPAEASQAIKAAKAATGLTDKFEFIGYDCCLMQVQDIAGLNSEYAKYQVASEESEWGYGWTYDGWIDDLFAKKSTTNILKAIVDSFKTETTSVYGSGSNNDQTLSYLDLSKWDAYETAWEDMASTLSGIVNSSSKWDKLVEVINSCQKYGQSEDYYGNTIYPFDVFDVGSFCTKMKASSSYKSNTTLMNKITAVQTAESELVAYEWHGGGSSGSTGVSLFAPLSGYSYQSDYSTSQTTLTNWRSICISYGSWYY